MFCWVHSCTISWTQKTYTEKRVTFTWRHYQSACEMRFATYRSGLLKWRTAGQIQPPAPLKVACGRVLIENIMPNDTHHVHVKWPPYFVQILHPVLPSFQQPMPNDPQFFWKFKHTIKNFGALCVHLSHILTILYGLWALSHKIITSFLARPTLNDPFF